MLYDEIKPFVTMLLLHLPYIEIVGSYSRNEYTVNDLDIITMTPIIEVINDIQKMLNNVKINSFEIKYIGSQYAKIIINFTKTKSLNIDIWSTNSNYEYKFLKWMRSIDKGRNIAYRKMARNKNYTLSDRYLYDNITKKFIDFNDIEELKMFLKQ
jgi:hypothetical protein